MPRISIFVKKIPQLGRLSLRQHQIYKLGQVATNSVKARVSSGANAQDSPAKPLSKGYAIFKTKKTRRKAQRDLVLTGGMLYNFQVRTVSENTANARNSTRRDRIKALANQRLEPWAVYSPANKRQVLQAFQKAVTENIRSIFK